MGASAIGPYVGPDRRGGAATIARVSYRGPDRRGRAPFSAQVDESRLARWAAVAALTFVVLVAVVLDVSGWRTTAYVLRVLSGSLYLLAGGALLLLARVTGRTRTAVVALALVTGGALCSILEPIAATLHDDPVLRAGSPACVLISGVAGLVFVVRAAWMDVVNTRLRLPRATAVATFAVLAGIVGLRAARARSGALDDRTAWALALCVLAGGWAVAGAAVAVRSTSLRGHAFVGLELVALTYLLAAGAAVGSQGLLVASCVVACVAAGDLTYAAVKSLVRVTRLQGARVWRLVGELDETTRVLAGQHASREELLHDARSAVASLQLANTTLERYGHTFDRELTGELRAAFDAELGRLGELLDAKPPAGAETFDLVALIRPLIRLAGDGGLRVAANLPPVLPVRGNRRDTATVVHTLLANAARYGGGRVRIAADRRAFDVRLEIVDDGPGIAPDEREAVFRRGFRGAASVGSEGSGLGLFVARRLMAAQDGGLAVGDGTSGGACFVLTIPGGLPPIPLGAPGIAIQPTALA